MVIFFLNTVQGEQAAMRLAANSNNNKDTGNYVPNSLRRVCGFLNVPCYTEDAGDGAYDFSSLSEKTRISNHLQM